jgi:N-acetylneuraminic acid mutarotase
MKALILTALFLCIHSSFSFADMVFMRENADSKHIMFQKDNQKAVQLTSGNAAHLYPDITTDGKKVVYVEGTIDEKGADLNLVLRSLEDNSVRVLKNDSLKGMILHPKLSKNGEQLYFSAPNPASGKNTVYFASLKTTSFQPSALDLSEESYFPRPSSDGNFVIYQRNTAGKKEIIFFDKLAEEKTVIAEGMSPSLSFDEKFIAFTSKKDGNWNIYLYDRFAKTTKQITNDANDEMAPTFTTDNKIVFASNRSGHFQLFKMEDNQTWTALHQTADADDYAPAFSGDTQFKQQTLASFPGSLRSSFGTLFHNGKLYMCGGHAGPEHTYPKESFTNEFVVFNPATNSWSSLAPRPSKAHGFQLAAHGKYIYAFGGFAFEEKNDPQWKSLDTIERYNIETNTWETVGHLNHPRSSNVAITIGSKVYVVGGWDSTPKSKGDLEGTFHSSIEIFDLENETIGLAPFELPAPLRRAFTGINFHGKILLVGGLGVGSSHFELINKLTVLDPQTGKTEDLPSLPFATFAPAAEMIGNEIYVFGGMFKISEMEYDYVSHIYALNLDTLKWRHTGRYLKETKGFSQVFKLDEKTLGILGGHHYYEDKDSPVNTFEIFKR